MVLNVILGSNSGALQSGLKKSKIESRTLESEKIIPRFDIFPKKPHLSLFQVQDIHPPPLLMVIVPKSGCTMISPGIVTSSNDPIRRFIEILAPPVLFTLLKKIAQ